MALQESVAPKERVNIVYRPATEGAQQEVELPLKLLVLGDFTLRDDEQPLEEASPIEVDGANLDQVLAALAPELQLQVPDMLQGSAAQQIALRLRFRCMADFSPDALLLQAPQLQALLRLREALKSLKGPLSNVPEFRRRLREALQQHDARQRLLQELGAAADAGQP